MRDKPRTFSGSHPAIPAAKTEAVGTHTTIQTLELIFVSNSHSMGLRVTNFLKRHNIKIKQCKPSDLLQLAHDSRSKSNAFIVHLAKQTECQIIELLKNGTFTNIPIYAIYESPHRPAKLELLKNRVWDVIEYNEARLELGHKIRTTLRFTIENADTAADYEREARIKTGTPTAKSSIQMDCLSYRTWFRKDEVFLTSAEFSILKTLTDNAGHVLSKRNIAKTALDATDFEKTRNIDVHICRIRKKIRRHSNGFGQYADKINSLSRLYLLRFRRIKSKIAPIKLRDANRYSVLPHNNLHVN